MRKVPADKPARQRFRGPSIRRRFVKRAETLKSDPAFLRNLERARRAWNHQFPRLVLHAPEPAPQDAFPTVLYFCPPPVLDRILLSRRLEDVPEVEPAWMRWKRLVLALCAWGWPAQHLFYNWLGPGRHPATIFVSACLIWDPATVQPEAILTGGLDPFPLAFDPNDEMSHPGAVFWRAFAQMSWGMLNDAVDRSIPIDEAWLAQTRDAALAAGLVARQRTLSQFSKESATWVLPVFPGITTTDRDEVIDGLVYHAQIRFGEDPLEVTIRTLHAQGAEPARIARLLGIDVRRVKQTISTG